MANLGLPESWSPWSTPRSSANATPKPGGGSGGGAGGKQEDEGIKKPSQQQQQQQQQKGGDHKINPRYWIGKQHYPDDCPPLNVRWYFATDLPKRKPANFLKPGEKAKPGAPPKKFSPFTLQDSKSIEQAFQKLATDQKSTDAIKHSLASREDEDGDIGAAGKSEEDADIRAGDPEAKVPVNEDYLFDVDIDRRELTPAYWLGPVYDVRRATWFYDSGSSNRPCEENLAMQLEEGYIKTKPWRNEPRKGRSSSQPKRPSSWMPGEKPDAEKLSSKPDGRAPSADRASENEPSALVPAKLPLQTHRLFGTYMNSIVTYENSTTAFMLTDDFMSRMSSTMYERFSGGGHLGGIRVVRGFVDAKVEKPKATKDADKVGADGRSKSQPARREDVAKEEAEKLALQQESEAAAKRQEIARQISSFVGTGPPDGSSGSAAEEEQVRKRQEQEIQDDYRDEDGAQQNREIEHLILVTHGIGQRLGMKMESLNFIHDVNTLRKTLKSIYETSPDLQALNLQVDQLPKNSRVQVLPIVWRHLLDFPHQSIKQRKKEHDLSDPDEELDYPQLSQITIEGVAPIRNLIEDLFLDILLYQSTYREHVVGIVQRECNRVYQLFKQRNPNFDGKVSLVGHSLGSAIFFDLLCRQKDPPQAQEMARVASKTRRRRTADANKVDDRGDYPLDFAVEDLYCLGSPIGLFQMIHGRTIAGRRSVQSHVENEPSSTADPFNVTVKNKDDPLSSIAVSSPKCAQLYNIFFPTDPIAYRIEPLVTPVMSNLKPQPLPQVKKGIFSTQGLQGIGSRVGQSVSGLWASMTTGIASSMLSRTLGMNEASQPNAVSLSRAPLSMGAGTNISAGLVTGPEELEAERKRRAASGESQDGVEHPRTLIDGEIETLYAGFEKARRPAQGDSEREHGANPEWQETENRSRQYRREEAKVRALNSNGRVDYAIQDSYLDISLISSITSHLSYWTDEDLSHFMISQLLSRQRIVKRQQS